LLHPALQEVPVRLLEDVPEPAVASLEDGALEKTRLVLGERKCTKTFAA